MNAALGRRTRARGFVPAPMISGGILVNSVGGGISQVATTLYNAAFFAGLRLIAHTPHSFYVNACRIGVRRRFRDGEGRRDITPAPT
jgi:vancomycin resistance protein YoaR